MSSYVEGPWLGSPACSFLAPGLALDVDYAGIMPLDSQTDTDATAAESTYDHLLMTADFNGDIPMDPFMGLMDNNRTPGPDQWLVPLDQASSTERPSSPADAEVVTAYEKMASFCVSLDFIAVCKGPFLVVSKSSTCAFRRLF